MRAAAGARPSTWTRVRASVAGHAEFLAPVEGGARRQDSVARGLEAGRAARPDLAWVLVHDAARCLVEPADASAVLDAARASGAALPVLPASDTVKWLDGARVERTLERARIGLAQTPQAFRVETLREALEKAERDGFEGTDCASLVERLGVAVATAPGRPGNFKVTHPDDLARAEAALARARSRADADRAGLRRTPTGGGPRALARRRAHSPLARARGPLRRRRARPRGRRRDPGRARRGRPRHALPVVGRALARRAGRRSCSARSWPESRARGSRSPRSTRR